MEIVKKNMVSIICGVVALLALVALAWPVSGMYADTQTMLNERVKVYSDLNALRTARRSWPVIPDIESGDKNELRQFPTRADIQEAEKIKVHVSEQSKSMQTATSKLNIHEPLLPAIFPDPKDAGFQFQNTYVKAVREGLSAELNAGRPPT